ncbi:MAG: hypothetical protein N2515_04270 [Deltaproteobacteria bacterium]|nr:hypothetical protein [Deltaproteobacteria bacterium]
MTIPVPNPPQYEIRRRPGGEGLAPPLVSQRPLTKGCVIAGLLLSLLGCYVCAGVGWTLFRAELERSREEIIGHIIRVLRESAEAQGSLEKHRGAIEQLEELERAKRIDWFTFSVLFNRWNEAKKDHKISVDEFEGLMALVRDIDARGGKIDLRDYHEMR